MTFKDLVERYLDTLVEPMFQRDEQGRELFFPMGLGSRGRVVPDRATGETLRASLRRGWLFCFLIWIPLLSAGAVLIPNGFAYLALMVVTMVATWAYGMCVGSGLEVTTRRMTPANQSAAILASYSIRKMLWMLLASVVLLAASIAGFHSPAVYEGQPAWFRSVTGFGVVLFGLTAIYWLFLLSKKSRQA